MTGRLTRYCSNMKRTPRPVPDLTDSTLVHASGALFVDEATGMVLSRVGYVGPTGYERVYVDGREVAAHRLVFTTIHGPLPDGCTVNHLDGDKANNHPANLEAATPSEQIAHAYRIGLRTGNGRAGKPRPSRLTAEEVQAIVDAPRGTVGALAASLGITADWAYQIRAGRLIPREVGA